MFVRWIEYENNREILVNTDFITKIYVTYVKEISPRHYGPTQLLSAQEGDPTAIRAFEVHVGGDKYHVIADPTDPVSQVFSDIYNKSIKGPHVDDEDSKE